jgi:hypothetical protein
MLCILIPCPFSLTMLVTLYSPKQVIQWHFYHHILYHFETLLRIHILAKMLLNVKKAVSAAIHLCPYFLFFFHFNRSSFVCSIASLFLQLLFLGETTEFFLTFVTFIPGLISSFLLKVLKVCIWVISSIS